MGLLDTGRGDAMFEPTALYLRREGNSEKIALLCRGASGDEYPVMELSCESANGIAWELLAHVSTIEAEREVVPDNVVPFDYYLQRRRKRSA